MKLKTFLKAIDYKITEGSEYCWNIYGYHTHRLERQTETGNSVSCVFDTNDQTIYELEAWDNSNDRVYRWIRPDYIEAYKAECIDRSVVFENAYDNVNFTDIEVEEDILEKIHSIANDIEYDTRVRVPIDFSDEELLKYMKIAHERDITFNQFVEDALQHAISEFDAGRLTKETAQDFNDDDYSEI